MSRKITMINRKERYLSAYVLAFGAYGSTQLLVYAGSLEDALDECVDWIAENAPGLLCDDMVNAEYRLAIAEGCSEDDAHERATADMTCAGNCGNYIASWEWAIVLDRASPREISAYVHAR